MFALTGDAPEAANLFAHAATLLGGRDPREIVQTDTDDTLHQNRVGQILCTLQALAATATLRDTWPRKLIVAGYSVGEVAAWSIAGLMDAKMTLDLVAQRAWIDKCYSGETLEDIIAALRGHDSGPAQDAANLIAGRSPIAVSVALEAVRRAAKLKTLEDVLIQDYRVSSASARSHDLVEGIRALIVDKDRNPKWSPATLAAVSAADIDAYFAPVADDLSF